MSSNSDVIRTPKLRSSCDACQSLKIKCGQEKPICRRCFANGIECVYGVSRRSGKPRRASPISPPPSIESCTTFDDEAFESFFDIPAVLNKDVTFAGFHCAERENFTMEVSSGPSSSCTCYLFALRTLEQFEHSSQPSTEVAFDTLFAQVANALNPTMSIAECPRCLSSSSYLVVFSLLVAKMVSLCLAGCEAYGIGEKERQEVADVRCTATPVRVGSYEISGVEEKIVIGSLMKKRLGEIEEILIKLKAAAEKLPHDGKSNGCKEVLAYAMQQLKIIS